MPRPVPAHGLRSRVHVRCAQLSAVPSLQDTHCLHNKITLVPCPPPRLCFSLGGECPFLPIHQATSSFFHAERPQSPPPRWLFKCLSSTSPVSSRRAGSVHPLAAHRSTSPDTCWVSTDDEGMNDVTILQVLLSRTAMPGSAGPHSRSIEAAFQWVNLRHGGDD